MPKRLIYACYLYSAMQPDPVQSPLQPVLLQPQLVQQPQPRLAQFPPAAVLTASHPPSMLQPRPLQPYNIMQVSGQQQYLLQPLPAAPHQIQVAPSQLWSPRLFQILPCLHPELCFSLTIQASFDKEILHKIVCIYALHHYNHDMYTHV